MHCWAQQHKNACMSTEDNSGGWSEGPLRGKKTLHNIQPREETLSWRKAWHSQSLQSREDFTRANTEGLTTRCKQGHIRLFQKRTEAVGRILKRTGIYSLPRFSQIQKSWLDGASYKSGQWAKTNSKSNPGVLEGKKVEYSAIAESISWF